MEKREWKLIAMSGRSFFTGGGRVIRGEVCRNGLAEAMEQAVKYATLMVAYPEGPTQSQAMYTRPFENYEWRPVGGGLELWHIPNSTAEYEESLVKVWPAYPRLSEDPGPNGCNL